MRIKWGQIGKQVGKIGLDFGLGVLANRGIPIDELIKRPTRRRRRRRGSLDYESIAARFREVLKGELGAEAAEEVELVCVAIARAAILEHQEEAEEEAEEVEKVEEAPPPRQKRRRKATKRNAKR